MTAQLKHNIIASEPIFKLAAMMIETLQYVTTLQMFPYSLITFALSFIFCISVD